MANLLSRCVIAALVAVSLVLASTTASFAVVASTYLAGTVTDNGQPVAGVTVTASGNNQTLTTTTDSKGHFRFPPLTVGTYIVHAAQGDKEATLRVDLANYGATVTLALTTLKQIVVVSTANSQTLKGSGSDVVLNSTDLTQMPFNNSFTEMEIQMPGGARGANGVVHMNGDHGVIDYTLDGVMLPQELNRDIGGEINLNDLSFVDLIEGAFPAQYGLKFGSVFNMATSAGTGPPGFYGNIGVGSYTDTQSTIGYHAPLPGGGGYDIAMSGERSTRGLDPPDFNSPNNDWSSLNQFARFTLADGHDDFTDITFVHDNDTYQIPDDTQFGEPAWTDDNEWQEDFFLAVQQHDTIGKNGSLTFGPAFKDGRIQDFGDPLGDFQYGETLNVTPGPYGNGGTPTDCYNAAPTPPGVSNSFLPTTCAFSLNDTRTAIDYIWQTDYTQQYGNHTFATGVTYDGARILKNYAITLQPCNFFPTLYLGQANPACSAFTPTLPSNAAQADSAVTVTDNAPNIGNTYSIYAQDSWRISPLWQADYGMRYDFFSIKSPGTGQTYQVGSGPSVTVPATGFSQGFGGTSPRFKLTYFIGKRASLYGYIGRFFEPFSLENVSPEAAYLLNLPLQKTPSAFDLTPERDTFLEFGGHIPVGRGDLGFRVFQKNANNLIDDTQVGVTLLHQDINYVLGRISQEAINYRLPLRYNSTFYVSGAHVISNNLGCETQLLAPCYGQPSDFTPADHEQRWSVESGILMNNLRGGWVSFDGEYGSGLSSAVCPPYPSPLNCKMTPHIIFNVEKGIAINAHEELYGDIQNLLNDRYYVTLLNAQGNHYAAPRIFNVGLRFH